MKVKEIKNIEERLKYLEKLIDKKITRIDTKGSTKKNKLLSIIIPAFNESDNIFNISESIIRIITPLSKKNIDISLSNTYDYEIIFVSDGSKDNTWQNIEEVSLKNKKVKGINFSRNFGKEVALTAGLEYSSGDIVITIDADGQHPVEKIPDFIKKWEIGYDIVYNLRPKIEGASIGKKISSKLFYYIYNSLSNEKMEEGITDYRLLDRKVVNEYLNFKEKNRIYRGIIDYIGFTKTHLTFDALERMDGGNARYSFGKLLKLAIDALTSFSVKPLKLIMILGFIIILIGFLITFLILIEFAGLKFFHFNYYLIFFALNAILIGIVMVSLGLVGIYVGNIHEEVKGRPLYIVKDNINLIKK